MKIMLSALVLFAAFSTQAARPNVDHNFTCRSEKKPYQWGKAARLKQIGSQKIVEGKKIPFVLEVFAVPPTRRPGGPMLVAPRVFSYYGVVVTEDVMLNFESHDKKVSLSVFMDELDQTTLIVDGSKTHMTCEEHRW